VTASTYREDRPSESLRPFVVCTWSRTATDGSSPSGADVILPDGCVDLVWDGESLAVAGPDTGPVVLDPVAARRAHAGVRFRPGVAPTFLGAPATELCDRRVPLEDLWGGASMRALADRLAAASNGSVIAVLERAVIDHAAEPVDALAGAAVRAIARVPSTRVDALADRLGVSERTLNRRMGAAVGYGPKVLARIVRFRRFLALLPRRDALSLADLAHAVGYADQAHLARECRALAGQTPAQLVAASRSESGVRFVQDGLTARGG
jgi:AraC-like DNA-binding protein